MTKLGTFLCAAAASCLVVTAAAAETLTIATVNNIKD